jgi:hypothetical protein
VIEEEEDFFGFRLLVSMANLKSGGELGIETEIGGLGVARKSSRVLV